jgi:membrane-associated phospholipid phosphatase
MVADINIKWARFVSDVVSPPVVWGIFSIFLAARDAANVGQAVLWAGIYVFLVCIMPVLFIAYRVKQGRITDIHMPLRHERFTPFMITIVGALISLFLMIILQASHAMQLLSLATLLQVAMMSLITLYWQISVHMIGISGAVVLTSLWFGGVYGVLISPLIIIVAAARLALKRHTPTQVIVGALVGSISFALFFTIVR